MYLLNHWVEVKPSMFLGCFLTLLSPWCSWFWLESYLSRWNTESMLVAELCWCKCCPWDQIRKKRMNLSYLYAFVDTKTQMDGLVDQQLLLSHGDNAKASVVQDDNLVNYFLSLKELTVFQNCFIWVLFKYCKW